MTLTNGTHTVSTEVPAEQVNLKSRGYWEIVLFIEPQDLSPEEVETIEEFTPESETVNPNEKENLA